jgi:hypothetical protein
MYNSTNVITYILATALIVSNIKHELVIKPVDITID